MSLSEVQRAFGYVPEEVIKELANDMGRAKLAGLTLSTDPGLVSDTGVTQARPPGSTYVMPDDGSGDDGGDSEDDPQAQISV
jgi:capsid protein